MVVLLFVNIIMLSVTAAATPANTWQAYGKINTVIQHLIIE